MIQKYEYQSYKLAYYLMVFFVIIFVVEYNYLAPIIAWATILPLLPLLLFLNNQYLYIIHDEAIEIIRNNSKLIILQITDIQEVKKYKNTIKLITQNNQSFTLYFKPSDVESFLSCIAK